MGGNGSCYLSKQVKAETAVPGSRVKFGWTAVVVHGSRHKPLLEPKGER